MFRSFLRIEEHIDKGKAGQKKVTKRLLSNLFWRISNSYTIALCQAFNVIDV